VRTAFVTNLVELAEQDPRILLLTGDLGFMAVEPFTDRFPDRFFNVGVAEQNMVGVATGLAEAGFIPFVYSIAPFATLRPYEFIRNGPVHQRLPVRIVGIGGGFEYGTNGPSHFALEDVAVMRPLPGLSVITPADPAQAAAALRATWDLPGPVYYRLGKNDSRVVPGLDGRYDLDRGQVVREGSDVLIIAMGAAAYEAMIGADLLAHNGLQATVAVISTMSPPPLAYISALLHQFRLAATVEAHYRVGGLGSLVSEVVAEQAIPCRIIRCGVGALHSELVGSEQFLARAHGISGDGIAAAILRVTQPLAAT